MIIDDLANANKYICLHPLFARAFGYIQEQDPSKMEPGKYEILGEDLKAIISQNPGKLKEEALSKFECHQKHIDIQFCISGKETFGWKPLNKCVQQKEPYNAEKDVSFYDETPDMYFQLTDNQFVIFFPEDVHAPMIGEGDIKKIVIKVKI